MIELFRRIVIRLGRTVFVTTYGRRFRRRGKGSFLFGPFRIDGAEGVSMGRGSVLQRGGWLYCVGLGGQAAQLDIGNGCIFGYNNHITAVRRVCIGDHVLTANNVYISDNMHAYEDIDVPVMHQPVVFRGEVEIGDGCWLGENVAVLGVKIGRQCVIGANAVVTSDIPDYCVAVGVPARVIRRYDPDRHSWMAANDETIDELNKND